MKSVETKLTTERERHEREMAAVREEFRNTLTTHKKEVKELKQGQQNHTRILQRAGRGAQDTAI